MAAFGRTVTKLDEAPVKPILLNNSKGEPSDGVYALMRQLPVPVARQLLKPALRRARQKDDDATEEAFLRYQREQVTTALVDTSGLAWAFDDAESIKNYEPFLPGLKAMDEVLLDGHWSEGFKARFLVDNPGMVVIFSEAYDRMTSFGTKEKREEDEGKGPISAVGSPSA